MIKLNLIGCGIFILWPTPVSKNAIMLSCQMPASRYEGNLWHLGWCYITHVVKVTVNRYDYLPGDTNTSVNLDHFHSIFPHAFKHGRVHSESQQHALSSLRNRPAPPHSIPSPSVAPACAGQQTPEDLPCSSVSLLIDRLGEWRTGTAERTLPCHCSCSWLPRQLGQKIRPIALS